MCSRDRPRLNHKIAQYIILGGFQDGKYYTTNSLISEGIKRIDNKRLTRYYPGSPQRWRNAHNFDTALSQLVKNYHVPIWFLKRSMNYISQECLWEKSSSWGSACYTNELISTKEKKGLEYAGADGHGILLSCDLPKKMTRTREVYVTIAGEKYIKREKYTEEVIYIKTTATMGVVVPEVANYYRNVQHRYYRIHGVDCKLCHKNVKHTKMDIICNDMGKYIDHLCPKCIKKFCKLTDGIKDAKMGRWAA